MKISDVYGGDWLKQEHLQGQDVTVQIESTTVEEVGDAGKRQVVLKFTGHEKRLGLNRTNAEQIAALYGDDTDHWPGSWITLYPDPEVMYGPKRVGGIRVRPVARYEPPPPPPAPAPVPVPPSMPGPAPSWAQPPTQHPAFTSTPVPPPSIQF